MAVSETQDETSQPAARARLWPRRWRSRMAAGGAMLALAGGSLAWFDRERIAGDILDNYLAQSGVRASYDIIAIGPRTEIVENIVIGDPARPDFTARRMVIELGVGWAGPEVRRVAIEGARAYGSYRGGTFSLGALDPLLFTDSKAPPALPAIELALTDARALIASDYGEVGIKLDGAGRLDDGFAGQLAATAPGIGAPDCRARTATLYGKLTTRGGAARLEGPLRLAGLDCGGARLERAAIGTRLRLARDFSGAEGDFAIAGSALAYAAFTGAAFTGAALSGTARLTWSGERLVAAHELALRDVTAPQGELARLAANGTWRAQGDGRRGQWQGELRGEDLAVRPDVAAALAAAETALRGTLAAPLLARARPALTEALNGASFAAEATIRHDPDTLTLTVPAAHLALPGGTRVLALSQASAGFGAEGLTGLRGNLLAGGAGLPQINGRIEQGADGRWALRLAMAEYRAGANRLAIPRLTLSGERSGDVRFEGIANASGELPGGAVSGLAVPLEGRWSPATGLALGPRCAPLRFDRLALSGLALPGRSLTLCPEDGAALLNYDGALTLAARTGPLAVTGTLGERPAHFSARSLALRYPAPFALEGLELRIGAPGSAVNLTADVVTGSLDGAIAGTITGGAARLDQVPLDLEAITGRWSFAEGLLRIEDTAFTLKDRPAEGAARFAPLAARAGAMTLGDTLVTAQARLRHPASDRVVAEVAIRHDLASTAGSARLAVPGLAFDRQLQPEDLSDLSAGVIALASGTVTGEGRIDWQGEDITSRGTIASDGLDFAAAFGPVRGLQGQVVFTDLLNLTTAPDQRVTVAAINPGIEVLSGEVRFTLQDGTLLRLDDARFPFMGGQLIMQPLALDFSQPEARRYVFEIAGLDAATFVAQMELTNLAATGTFDGTVPIVFDAEGNGRIERGLLHARAGGGNVAYIGELTYEDLGTMGNYAFAALRSLDYRQMSVGLNGSLGGEIITNFDFDGVRQGTGTSQNFVTRRLARLPIRFKVNVRSENFYELSIMVRSLWDVNFLGSPVDRGLLKAEDGRFVPAARPDRSVQPTESETQP